MAPGTASVISRGPAGPTAAGAVGVVATAKVIPAEFTAAAAWEGFAEVKENAKPHNRQVLSVPVRLTNA